MIQTTGRQDSNSDNQLLCQLSPGSRIKLIGLGGTGCIVLDYLALFLKSLSVPLRLVLIDGDIFESKNTTRMHFSNASNKAETKAREMLQKLGSCSLSIVPVPEYVTSKNVARLLRHGDYVIMCVDNHPTRKLVSNHCEKLPDVALFSGGNEGVDPPRERGTYGNVSANIRRDGKNLTAPITQYHPEIIHTKGKMPDDPDCAQMAVSTPQILFANLAVASALLNTFFAYTCGQLNYQEVMFDILDARMLPQFPLSGANISAVQGIR